VKDAKFEPMEEEKDDKPRIYFRTSKERNHGIDDNKNNLMQLNAVEDKSLRADLVQKTILRSMR
jgi:hypothetical protein